MDLKEEIEKVLEGEPFSRNPDVRRVFTDVTLALFASLSTAQIRIHPRRVLIRKLAKYCIRMGWQQPTDSERPELSIGRYIEKMPMIVDALIEAPEGLMNAMPIKQLLDRHDATTACRAAALKVAQRESSAPPACLLFADDKDYELVELTSPTHLREESAALGHCVGTLYNKTALKEHGLQEGDAGAEQYLQYAMQMRAGKTRIFSLRHRGKPVATIDYDAERQAIVQIEGRAQGQDKNRAILTRSPHFVPLCNVLGDLRQIIPLRKIQWQPSAVAATIITRNGVKEGHEVRPADILLGDFKVDMQTAPDVLAEAFASPLLTVDVTRLRRDLVPPVVKSRIFTQGETVRWPHLREASGIDAPNAVHVNLPSLTKVEEMRAEEAMSVTLPKLVQARDIFFESPRHLLLPKLQKVGALHLALTDRLILPELKTAGYIHVHAAEAFTAPKLERAGHIEFDNVPQVRLNGLRRVELLMAYGTTLLHMPQLEEYDQIALNRYFNPRGFTGLQRNYIGPPLRPSDVGRVTELQMRRQFG